MDKWQIKNVVHYEYNMGIYGYVIKLGTENRIISFSTAAKMIDNGKLESSYIKELSLVTVPINYKEDTRGLL